MPDSVYLPSQFGSAQFALLDQYGNNLLAGAETFSRDQISSSAAVTLTSQVLRLSYFTAPAGSDAAAVTKINTYSGTTAAGATPTLCRSGLYLIDGAGGGTLVASHASDTTMWATQNTEYSKTLTAAYFLVPGARYATGALCVTAAAAPTMAATASVNIAALYTRAPTLCASITAQADLPASFVVGSLATSAQRMYASVTVA